MFRFAWNQTVINRPLANHFNELSSQIVQCRGASWVCSSTLSKQTRNSCESEKMTLACIWIRWAHPHHQPLMKYYLDRCLLNATRWIEKWKQSSKFVMVMNGRVGQPVDLIQVVMPSQCQSFICVCVCVCVRAKVFMLTNRELCYFFTAETLPQFSSAMLMFASQAELECLAVGLIDISRKYNYYWNSNHYYFLYLTQYNVYELRSCLLFSLPADFLYSLFSVAWSWKNIEVLSTACQEISPTNEVDGWPLFSEWI